MSSFMAASLGAMIVNRVTIVNMDRRCGKRNGCFRVAATTVVSPAARRLHQAAISSSALRLLTRLVRLMGGEEAVEFCVEGDLRLRGLSLVFFAVIIGITGNVVGKNGLHEEGVRACVNGGGAPGGGGVQFLGAPLFRVYGK